MAAVAVLAALLTVIVAPAPAQAVSAPTTSPSAAVRYWTTDIEGITCESGYACATVPYGSGVYVFKFYYYGTYYLSNWYGWGWGINNQTGGAAMRILNSSGGQMQCIAPPPVQWTTDVYWTPVYRIQLTSSSC
jgi:hypothetical protein